MLTSPFSRPCPCGSEVAYDRCCGPLHRGERQAVTAVELMRSRYSAYAVDDLDYVFRTWHPRTRPDDLGTAPGPQWTGLTIIDIRDGGPDDEHGEVEFEATFVADGAPGSMHERSRFARRAGRWFYLDGRI